MNSQEKLPWYEGIIPPHQGGVKGEKASRTEEEVALLKQAAEDKRNRKREKRLSDMKV